MLEQPQESHTLTRSDFDQLTAALSARFPTRLVELKRVSDMDVMLAAAGDFARALAAHTQQGLALCHGDGGDIDLERGATAVWASMGAWLASVRDIAERYPHPLLVPPVTVETALVSVSEVGHAS